MQVAIVDQPFSELLAERLRVLLVSEEVTAVFVASAWVRRRGIELIGAELAALTSRLPARKVRGLFGVDLGGTTREGLEASIDAFEQVRGFHSPGRPARTFHPKLYYVETATRVEVCIGSANLTLGGLAGNFESVALLTIDRSGESDAAVANQFEAWFDRYWNDPNASVRVTRSSLPGLVNDPSIWIPREDEARKVLAKRTKTRSSRRSKFTAADGVLPLPKVPGGSSQVVGDEESDEPQVDLVEGLPLDVLATPTDTADLRCLIAPVPFDRWGQIGLSRHIAENFFRVFTNGDLVWVEGVRQSGALLPAREAALVNPSTTNDNHRLELPEPDGRPDPKPDRCLVVVLERSLRSFRFVHLRPGDAAYASMATLISQNEAYGPHNSPETKRVVVTFGELTAAWPGKCLLSP